MGFFSNFWDSITSNLCSMNFWLGCSHGSVLGVNFSTQSLHFENHGIKDVPKPRIKEEKVVNGTRQVQLVWGNDIVNTKEFTPEENMVTPEEEYDSLESTCNTKKNHGSRMLRYTAGIFIGKF